jgi:hypothetical protein
MHFPAQAPMHALEELVAWAKPRYRFVRKTYDGFDVAAGATGPTVYAFGTLHGEWLDGTAFAGIRFVDRFETEGGLFTRQDVWNDMAETKAGHDGDRPDHAGSPCRPNGTDRRRDGRDAVPRGLQPDHRRGA